MPHHTIKSEKTWLNTDPDCLAACRYQVLVYYNEKTKAAEISAEITISDEGRSHWVSRKAHLRPIRTMRRILDAFEEAVQEAYTWIEENGYEFTSDDADRIGVLADV